jgi:hypothetical protein
VTSSAPSSSKTGPSRRDADDSFTSDPQAMPPSPTAKPFRSTDLSAPTRISVGDPVTDTAFDGVLCRAGQPVAFWGSGGVHSCTLAKDTPAQDAIADAERGTVTVRFVCASDRRLEFQPGVGKEVASCFLATPVEVQHVPCAAGSEIEIVNARLITAPFPQF